MMNEVMLTPYMSFWSQSACLDHFRIQLMVFTAVTVRNKSELNGNESERNKMSSGKPELELEPSEVNHPGALGVI